MLFRSGFVGGVIQGLKIRHEVKQQQEELARKRAAEAQEAAQVFSVWSQGPDGQAFLGWRKRADGLIKLLRSRDSEWGDAWARAIIRTRSEVPRGEVGRLTRRAALLRQTGLKVAAIVIFVLAGMVTSTVLVQMIPVGTSNSTGAHGGFTYDDCLAALAKPDNFLMSEADCAAIDPASDGPSDLRILTAALLTGLGIAMVVTRMVRRRAAQRDRTVENEARARVDRWGFDPFAVAPGFVGFPWCQSLHHRDYADRLAAIAFYDGHGYPPTRADLLPLETPVAWPPRQTFLPELNAVLARFQ